MSYYIVFHFWTQIYNITIFSVTIIFFFLQVMSYVIVMPGLFYSFKDINCLKKHIMNGSCYNFSNNFSNVIYKIFYVYHYRLNVRAILHKSLD